MTSTPRRSGIRLPWSSGAPDEANAAEPAVEPMPAAEPTPAAVPAPESAMPAPEPAPPAAQAGASAELLRDLVAAMRGVVTASRDGALASLRASVDEAGAGLDASTVERQAALRNKAEADIAEIGDWERAEIERVRGEAVVRVSKRRAVLDQELAEASARRDADHAALQQRLDAYTGELVAFMAELDHIADPAAFAATARRMPSPPTIASAAQAPAPVAAEPAASEPVAAATPPPSAPESLPERLAELDQQLAATEPSPDQPAAAAGSVASTRIVVRGLGSFGAITSFKQALERAEGVSGVALALGPGGEFVYTASHAPGADVPAAIRSVEPDAEISLDGDTLRVKVTRTSTR